MDWLRGQRKAQEKSMATLPLRLLFVTTSAGMGGIEVCSARLAGYLQARGHRVAQVCRAGGTVDALCRELGVPTHLLSLGSSGDLLAAARLARVIVAHAADIVHVHSRRDFVPAVAAVALARRFGARPRLVLHAHLAKPLGSPGRLSGLLFARQADRIIAVSDAVRYRLLAAHGLPHSFVQRIHNGVDSQRFLLLPGTRARVRSRWGVPQKALVIGMVGRLDAKGQDTLLDALPRLIPRFPSLHVVLVGSDGAAGARAALEHRARVLGMGSRVVFTGVSADIPEAMAGFDLLAHLPVDEAFGMVLIEAMAAGLPIVAARMGGCPEVVQEGVTGCLVRLGSEDSLVAALSGLLACEEYRKTHGDGRPTSSARKVFFGGAAGSDRGTLSGCARPGIIQSRRQNNKHISTRRFPGLGQFLFGHLLLLPDLERSRL